MGFYWEVSSEQLTVKNGQITMKNIALLVTISLLFLSCLEERKEISFWDDFYKTPYVISEKNKHLIAINDSLEKAGVPYELLPFGTDTYGSVYGNLNIIFYEDLIFLHHKNLMFRCRSGNMPIEEEVDYVNLNTSDITHVSKDSFFIKIDILKSRLSSLDSSYHLVTISSLSDTITNPIFNILIDSVRKVNPRFVVRRITEEEHHVLDAKTKNIPYDPKNYNWVMDYDWFPFKK